MPAPNDPPTITVSLGTRAQLTAVTIFAPCLAMPPASYSLPTMKPLMFCRKTSGTLRRSQSSMKCAPLSADSLNRIPLLARMPTGWPSMCANAQTSVVPYSSLNSCSSDTRRFNTSAVVPAAAATSANSSSLCGRNSCSGGSSSRIVTGSPAMMRNSSTKSCRWNGSSLSSAARRPPSSSAMIIWRTMLIRSGAKNMCSVRHRPMPSAPNLRAVSASSGVSALVRTLSLRTPSAHAISVAKSSLRSGSIIATDPENTSPVAPSSVIVSPARIVAPPDDSVCAL